MDGNRGLLATLLTAGDIRREAQQRRDDAKLKDILRQAQIDKLTAEAGIAQDTLSKRGDVQSALSGLGDLLSPQEAEALASLTLAGGKFGDVSRGFTGLRQDSRRSSAQQALASGDQQLGNSFLAAIAGKPVSSVDVKGGQVISDRFGNDPSVTPTLGEIAAAAANSARARSADANAALLTEKRTNPAAFVRGSGGQSGREPGVFQIQDESGALKAVVSQDGQTFVGADGSTGVLPAFALPLTSVDAAKAVRGERTVENASDLVSQIMGEAAGPTATESDVSTASEFLPAILAPEARFFSNLFGGSDAASGVTGANARLKLLREQIIPSLVKNKRFPVAEQQRILSLAPSASIIDPQKQIANARALEQTLVASLETMNRNLSSATTAAEQSEIASAINETAQAIRLLRTGGSGVSGQPQAPEASFVQPGPSQGIPTPQTDEEYAVLPSGAIFIDPDTGQKLRKP